MFNLSDKELDRLSRKAADAYEVENNTSSWEPLEQRLDKELGNVPKPSVPSPRSFTFPFAYTSLIILLVGSSYFLLKSGKNSNEANKKNYSITSKQQATDNNSSKETPAIKADEKSKIAAAPDAKAAANDKKIPEENKLHGEKTSSALSKEVKEEKHFITDSKKNSSSQKNNEGKSKNEISTTREKNNSLNDKLLTAKNYVANNDNKTINYFSSRNKGTINNKLSSQKNKNNDISDNNNEKAAVDKSTNNHSPGSVKIFNNNLDIKQSEENNLEYASTSQAKQSVNHSSIIINDSSLRSEIARINAQHIIDLNKANSKSLNTNRSLQIGVSFAPDFSEVKHAYDNTRLGGGIGITLGYYLLSRLSVNTGLIFEHKYYQVDDKDFHMPPNFSLNGAHVDFVNGSCKMIEIPLNLRYDFSVEGNTIFFVNGGLSSYLMQNQDYSYYCHSNIGYNAFRINQSFDKQQNFWFSTVNLSAGFETNVSNAFSIQVDPYIKIPLKGVGVGNVQLNSYGINAAIKFSPALKKSRR